MNPTKSEVVICGAGIAGISVAWQLAVRHGVKKVVLVDERPPMSLTSDKSTEAYRNWWPGPDDEERVARGSAVFENLYACFAAASGTKPGDDRND